MKAQFMPLILSNNHGGGQAGFGRLLLDCWKEGTPWKQSESKPDINMADPKLCKESRGYSPILGWDSLRQSTLALRGGAAPQFPLVLSKAYCGYHTCPLKVLFCQERTFILSRTNVAMAHTRRHLSQGCRCFPPPFQLEIGPKVDMQHYQAPTHLQLAQKLMLKKTSQQEMKRDHLVGDLASKAFDLDSRNLLARATGVCMCIAVLSIAFSGFVFLGETPDELPFVGIPLV